MPTAKRYKTHSSCNKAPWTIAKTRGFPPIISSFVDIWPLVRNIFQENGRKTPNSSSAESWYYVALAVWFFLLHAPRKKCIGSTKSKRKGCQARRFEYSLTWARFTIWNVFRPELLALNKVVEWYLAAFTAHGRTLRGSFLEYVLSFELSKCVVLKPWW